MGSYEYEQDDAVNSGGSDPAPGVSSGGGHKKTSDTVAADRSNVGA